MNKSTVQAAKIEMLRFRNKLSDWEQANKEKGSSYWTMPKECGALRRASLDLTRALAAMRKSG